MAWRRLTLAKLNICLQTGEEGGERLSLDDGKLLLSTTFADNFLSTPGRNSNIPNFTSGFDTRADFRQV